MDQQTIDTYNKLAKEYDEETKPFWGEVPRTFIDKFVSVSGQKVLDIGSGPGRDGLILKNSGKDVVCLDASSEMIRLSKSNGLNSVLGDFNSLPFDDNSFNAVWAYTSLLHTPKNKIGKPLEEIKRVLVGGGMFGLGMIEGETEEYRESSGMKLPRLFSFYKKEELEKIVTDNGFELVYFEQFKPRTRVYLNFIFRKL